MSSPELERPVRRLRSRTISLDERTNFGDSRRILGANRARTAPTRRESIPPVSTDTGRPSARIPLIQAQLKHDNNTSNPIDFGSGSEQINQPSIRNEISNQSIEQENRPISEHQLSRVTERSSGSSDPNQNSAGQKLNRSPSEPTQLEITSEISAESGENRSTEQIANRSANDGARSLENRLAVESANQTENNNTRSLEHQLIDESTNRPVNDSANSPKNRPPTEQSNQTENNNSTSLENHKIIDSSNPTDNREVGEANVSLSIPQIDALTPARSNTSTPHNQIANNFITPADARFITEATAHYSARFDRRVNTYTLDHSGPEQSLDSTSSPPVRVRINPAISNLILRDRATRALVERSRTNLPNRRLVFQTPQPAAIHQPAQNANMANGNLSTNTDQPLTSRQADEREAPIRQIHQEAARRAEIRQADQNQYVREEQERQIAEGRTRQVNNEQARPRAPPGNRNTETNQHRQFIDNLTRAEEINDIREQAHQLLRQATSCGADVTAAPGIRSNRNEEANHEQTTEWHRQRANEQTRLAEACRVRDEANQLLQQMAQARATSAATARAYADVDERNRLMQSQRDRQEAIERARLEEARRIRQETEAMRLETERTLRETERIRLEIERIRQETIQTQTESQNLQPIRHDGELNQPNATTSHRRLQPRNNSNDENMITMSERDIQNMIRTVAQSLSTAQRARDTERLERQDRFEEDQQIAQPRRVPSTQSTISYQQSVTKSMQRKIDAIKLSENAFIENIKKIVKMGDIIYNGLDSIEEDHIFTQEMKFKCAGVQEINTDQIIGASDWPDLKRILNEISGQDGNWSAVEHKIQNLRQTHGESMLTYTQRATNLYNEYLNLYGIALPEVIRDKAGRDIARQFIKGLTSKHVRNALTVHGLRHKLPEIMRLAIEQDSLQQINEPDMELVCLYCCGRGHRQRDCLNRERAIRESNTLSMDSFARCAKCGSIGHTANICKVNPQNRVNQANNQQNQNQQSNQNNSNRNRNQNETRSEQKSNRNEDRNDRSDRDGRQDNRQDNRRDNRRDDRGGNRQDEGRNRDRRNENNGQNNRNSRSNRDDRSNRDRDNRQNDNRGRRNNSGDRGGRQNRYERGQNTNANDQSTAYPQYALQSLLTHPQYALRPRAPADNRYTLAPNSVTAPLAQSVGQTSTQAGTTAPQSQTLQPARSARNIQAEETFEPPFHSTEHLQAQLLRELLSENYEG